jgi:hypothetical protein
MSEKPSPEILIALAPFIWPTIFVVCVYLLRHRLQEIVSVVLRRIESATDIEFGSLKFKGATVTLGGAVLKNESGGLKLKPALESLTGGRNCILRAKTSCLFIRSSPLSPPDLQKYRIFGVSVFLQSHRQVGRINDVRQVTYFLGRHWGKDGHTHGSKYVIENGSEQFAMTAEMYGSCLCVAEIEFHDGTTIEVDRYLDVEMAPLFGIPLSKARQ